MTDTDTCNREIILADRRPMDERCNLRPGHLGKCAVVAVDPFEELAKRHPEQKETTS